MAFALALLGWVAAHTLAPAMQWHAVVVMAAACVCGELLEIRASDTLSFSCGDAFFLIAFIVLQPGEVMAVLAIVAVAQFVTLTSSWLYAAATATSGVVSGLASVGAVAWAKSWVGMEPAGLVLLAAIGFAVWRIAHFAMFLVVLVGQSDLPAEVRAMPKAMLHDALVQIPVFVPASILGALAFPQASWSIVLLVVPYAAMWHTTRQRVALAQVRHRVLHDVNTGLLNRLGFAQDAEERFARAARSGRSVALLVGDLDDFKRVNDTLGHLAGDEALIRAATAMQGCVPAGSTVARYGGEEFVILMDGDHPEDARRAAERVRCEVRSAISEFGSSLSIGMAWSRPGEEPALVFDRADRALYAAKRGGKDRVYEWSDMNGDAMPIVASAPGGQTGRAA